MKLRNITPSGGFRVSNVTVTASGSTGFNFGTYVDFSSPIINNLTATADGASSYGVFNYDSGPTIRNSSITGAVWGDGLAYGDRVRIFNSTLSAIPTIGNHYICKGTFITSDGSVATCPA